MVDVAVGLLRGENGSVALEEALCWRTGRLAGRGTGVEFDGAFVEGLERGMEKWGVEKYGEKADFDIPLDLS